MYCNGVFLREMRRVLLGDILESIKATFFFGSVPKSRRTEELEVEPDQLTIGCSRKVSRKNSAKKSYR